MDMDHIELINYAITSLYPKWMLETQADSEISSVID